MGPMTIRVEVSAGELFAPPRAVEIRGNSYLVPPLRIVDIAALEDAAATAAGHPLSGLEADLAACEALPPGDRARVPYLIRLSGATSEWPPRLGSDAFRAFLGSAAGAARYLLVALARCRPAPTPAACAGLAGRMTAAEWSALNRAAWGSPSWEAFGAGEGDGGPPGQGTDWGKSIDGLSRGRGLSYEAIGAMTLAQFRNALAGGERRKARLAAPAPEPEFT